MWETFRQGSALKYSASAWAVRRRSSAEMALAMGSVKMQVRGWRRVARSSKKVATKYFMRPVKLCLGAIRMGLL